VWLCVYMEVCVCVGRCNLALMLMTDLVLDTSLCIDWTVHLPFVLHLAILGQSPLECGVCVCVRACHIHRINSSFRFLLLLRFVCFLIVLYLLLFFFGFVSLILVNTVGWAAGRASGL